SFLTNLVQSSQGSRQMLERVCDDRWAKKTDSFLAQLCDDVPNSIGRDCRRIEVDSCETVNLDVKEGGRNPTRIAESICRLWLSRENAMNSAPLDRDLTQLGLSR